MKTFKRILKAVLILLVVLLIIASFLFAPIDRQPYQEKAYYQEMLKEVENAGKLPIEAVGDTIQAGWAKASLLPRQPVPLAGFGNRRGKIMEGIKDSLWVRAFVFDNKITKAVILTMDLLIVPPEVEISLKNELVGLGYNPDHLYLTATHTHSSVGAWSPGLVGELIAGEFDTEMVNFITEASIEAIVAADNSKQTAKIGFAQLDAGIYVENRLVGDEGIVDPWLRLIKIIKRNGEVAVLATHAAHATCYGHTNMHLSRDYPGVFVDSLESTTHIQFAAFAAGAVGSHRPAWMPTPEEQIVHVANGLFNLVKNNIETVEANYTTELKAFQVNLPLREPHVRISRNWRLRPWIFTKFFGNYPFHINFFKMGNNLWIGTPCDFSGELMPGLVEASNEEGYNLIVTSFNGGYIGYVTLDKWYDLDKYETMAMNWFGPYNGAYMTEYMKRIMKVM